ncbi:hypothetical protein AX16_006385 [Volvariella volvacea WC 439]|nr:hypothetical protein AX16_006385 [Volvariella volvacea WC 439]
MLLASLFVAAFARSLASPVPVAVPSGPIPSPLCVVSAAISSGTCDGIRMRSLFDILWSCLGVIFLCTYISIHHNIHDQNDSEVKKTFSKFRTMFYALLAPEVVIMWALRQRFNASGIAVLNPGTAISKIYGEDSSCTGEGWTQAHGFFVQMGGLMAEVAPGEYEVVLWKWVEDDSRRFFTKSSTQLQCDIPIIREKEIIDRGKGDFLAKFIVVIQTSWFIAQCVVRLVYGFAVTELELATLAFAVLNGITYVLWWNKPLNVEYPIYFDMDGNRVPGPEGNSSWFRSGGVSVVNEDKISIIEEFQTEFDLDGLLTALWKVALKKPFTAMFGPLLAMTNEEGNRDGLLTSVHPFYAALLDPSRHRNAYGLAAVIGAIFGGIHLIGWNFPFLTPTELWIWRVSSVTLTAIPTFVMLSWLFKDVTWWSAPDSEDTAVYRFFWQLVILGGSPAYIAARFAIITLACFQLRDLPASAYVELRWTEYMPHILSSWSVTPPPGFVCRRFYFPSAHRTLPTSPSGLDYQLLTPSTTDATYEIHITLHKSKRRYHVLMKSYCLLNAQSNENRWLR